MTPSQQEQSSIPSITVGRLASFWNFARSDNLAAVYRRQRTLLDTEDLALWRSCGLQIQSDGTLYASSVKINNPAGCRQTIHLVSHTLLWLILRVTNYIAADHDPDPAKRQATWDELTRQLDAWYSDLPETFQPCAQVRYPLQMRSKKHHVGLPKLTEVFFSINQCAAAIQLYHWARIVLLLNKPTSGNRTVSRLKAYREVSAEAVRTR